METIFVLAVGLTAFLVIATVAERFGWIAGEPPCDCDECHRARRDPFRPW